MEQGHRSPLCRRLFCLVLSAALLCLAGCGAKQKALSWQEQYDLGVRYLSEGKYEEAVLAFEAAIEIDPKRPEAYASLADAHLAAGDEAAAAAALEQGVAATGDEGLQGRLEGLTPPASPQPSPTPAPADGLFAGPFLAPEELELMQLDLVPEGATLAVQQTEQGTVGWVTTLSPAEGGEGGVQFGFRDGSAGEYTNSVQLAFYGGVLNQATVYGV